MLDVKEVQETAPFLEDGRLIFLLCQLIVDVLKLNGFGVVVVRHTADTIREHPLKGNATAVQSAEPCCHPLHGRSPSAPVFALRLTDGTAFGCHPAFYSSLSAFREF